MVDIGRRERRKGMSLVLLLVAAFWATPTYSAQQFTLYSPYPPGVYGMWPVADPISSSETGCVPTFRGELLLQNQGVVGIVLEVPWTSVDTSSTGPSPDFTQMNHRLIEAQLCGLLRVGGLPVALSLQTPLAGLPTWVVQQITCSPPSLPCPNGMKIQTTVSLGISNGVMICPGGTALNPNCLAPVFWDSTFSNDRVGFIQAAAVDIYGSTTLAPAVSPAVSENIVAVLAQPFGATTDDWNIPHEVDQVAAWQAAAENSTSIYGTNTCPTPLNPNCLFIYYMFGAAQTILNAAAEYFPTLNLKLPIQSEGTALDALGGPYPTTCIPPPGTDVALATQVLCWAYGTSSGFSGKFFAQLNFVRANTNPSAPDCATSATPCPFSPKDCASPCVLDPSENPESPYSVFNLIRQYQPQGVGLQDVDAAVDGGVLMMVDGVKVESCQQYGTTPCTPCDSPPVQYDAVSQNTWDVVQTYTPRFWEIGFDDATTTTPTPSMNNNGCQITGAGQAALGVVFSNATTQTGGGLAITASGLAYSRVSRTFNGTVTIQNISSSTISGPFYVLFTGLTDGVTLANPTGTYIGVPYVTPTAASLAPRQTATAAVRFNNPTFVTINFNPLVYTGSL